MEVRASLHARLVEPGQAIHEAVAKPLQGYAFVGFEGIGGGDTDEVEAQFQGVVFDQVLEGTGAYDGIRVAASWYAGGCIGGMKLSEVG